MKLYDIDISPYAARVRIQIRHKNLPVEICPTPYDLRTPEFKAAFPLGKIPVLDLLDGQTIGESRAILNFLETLYPEPPMRPANALACAQDEMLIGYTDTHMSPALLPLFQEFFLLDSVGGEPQKNPERFDLLKPELAKLQGLLVALPDFRQRDLQLGDLCLSCHMYYVLTLADYFSEAGIIDGFPNIKAWYTWVNDFDVVANEIRVMDDGFQLRMLGSKTA